MSGNKNLHPVSTRSCISTGYGEELRELAAGKNLVNVSKDETNEDAEEEFTDKPQLTLVEKVYGERYPGVNNPETLVQELTTRDQAVHDGSTPEAETKKVADIYIFTLLFFFSSH